ncbi:hypothetical protein FVR03_12330 [Pontibacter qinzhouensis]|uniref:Helix-turn-helix domain-containing protein n=1 Tax=Pontibacter qinzhouensis TaxID=2603253 RepID=A0A5C8K532_9BACT|nr:helix-turn-helix domain-containing protein [Pontibacter qinzhouensis]TXK45728.1 hypothetical protein FVR03_12330 [Pontibacter qinzhouensis]
MGKALTIEIKESPEELLRLSRKQKHPLAQARLRAFYLCQSGQAGSCEQLSEQLGYERHAVGRWLRLYRERGLAACLEVATTGRPRGSVIGGRALEELQAKLSDAGHYFTSYKQIQRWLKQEHGIGLSYEHVHRFVRYRLGAKLKVVRRSNLRKDAAYEEKFKKN